MTHPASPTGVPRTGADLVQDVVRTASAVRVAGRPRTSGQTVPVPQPADGSTRPVHTGTGTDAQDALGAAAAAMPGWAATDVEQRAAALHAVADRLDALAAHGAWAELISRETGKRRAEAQGEIGFSAGYFRTFAELLLGQRDQQESRVPGHRHTVRPRPRGIAVALTPWNFPVSIPARKIAPALAAGSAVLFKPSQIASMSAMVLSAVLDEVLPTGLVGTVLGTPEEVVDPWLTSDEVGVVSFTGSTRVGGLVGAAAGRRFLPTVLELGGCAPFIVLPDADPARAVDALMVAKFRNNGQSCIAANQIMVAREVADAVIDDLAARVRALRVGDPLDAGTELGPMAPAGDPARLAALVQHAVAGGARIAATAAVPQPGHYAPPTVLVDVPTDAEAFRAEVFGPVAAVHVYDDLDEAMVLHRGAGYGLAGYVCGTDLDAATALGRRLHAGIVGINTGTPNHPSVPFGGLGWSGLGYEGGRQGLEAFQTFQTVAVGSP